jgi:hypothetical protein
MRSGSSLAPWAVRSRNTALNSELLATWLGCGAHFPDNAGVKLCMQQLSIDKLIAEWRHLAEQDIDFVREHGKTQPMVHTHI